VRVSSNDRGDERRLTRPVPLGQRDTVDPRDESGGTRPTARAKNGDTSGATRRPVAPSASQRTETSNGTHHNGETTVGRDATQELPVARLAPPPPIADAPLTDAAPARSKPARTKPPKPARGTERATARGAKIDPGLVDPSGPIDMPAVVEATPPPHYASAPTEPTSAAPPSALHHDSPYVLPPGPPPGPTLFDGDATGEASYPVADVAAMPLGVNTRRAVSLSHGGQRRRPRVRRVTRVVRHVDPWSVFKVALCFSFVLYGVCLTAGVLLWNVAYTTGTIDNVERFFESFGWDTFTFKGGELFHNAWIAGLFAAIGLTGLIVLGATLFNLITDLVGGIRVTVLEEEVVERNPAAPSPLLRRRVTEFRRINDHLDGSAPPPGP
jgi:hypothetical protein